MFGGSWVPWFLGSGVLGFGGSWVRWFLGSVVLGFGGPWVRWFLGSVVLGFGGYFIFEVLVIIFIIIIHYFSISSNYAK